jgi:hypothetical protein
MPHEFGSASIITVKVTGNEIALSAATDKRHTPLDHPMLCKAICEKLLLSPQNRRRSVGESVSGKVRLGHL